MRTIIILTTISLVAANVASASDWSEIARNDKSFVLIDRDSIHETNSGTNGVLRAVLLLPYASNKKPGSKVIMAEYSYKANCIDQRISTLKMTEFSDLEGTNKVASVGPFPFSSPASSIEMVALKSICGDRVALAGTQDLESSHEFGSNGSTAIMLCPLSNEDKSVMSEKTYKVDYGNSTVNDWPADISDIDIKWSESNDHQLLALSLSRYSGRIEIRLAGRSTLLMSGKCRRIEERLL